jgi:fatty-acyl-CoA synthase
MMDTTLIGLLERAAQEHADREAVVFPERRRTYRELWDAVQHRARGLDALGVTPGQHVGLIMPNSMETVELLFAISAAGGVPVPFNPRYRAGELAYVVDHADVETIVVSGRVTDGLDFAARLQEALPSLAGAADPRDLRLAEAPSLRRVVLVGDSDAAAMISEAEVEALAARDTRPIRHVGGPDEVCVMMYTSGTTARPKGALLSHTPIVQGGIALAGRYELAAEDRLWDPLPLFHMAGILGLTAAASTGGAFLCMSRIDADSGLAMLEQERATVAFIGFPTLAQSLVEHPDFDPAALTALRVLHTHGLPEVLRRLQRQMPQATVINPYGCTEAGGLVSLSELSDDLDERVEYSGRPYPGLEVSVVDEEGRHLGAGRRGELVVRGWSVFEGYHKNPEATRAVIDEQGWFHTGDLGELDQDGRIRYVSRLKDMLKVGGENVAAAEIENLLSEHPSVSVAQVVGIPDPRLEEVPAAFVELVPGSTATGEELRAFCDGRIASFKVPRLVRIVDEWPMSATKIQKFRLRDQLVGERAGR